MKILDAEHQHCLARLKARYPEHPEMVALSQRLTVMPFANNDGKITLADPGTGALRIRSLVSTTAENAYGFRIAREAWADVDAYAEFFGTMLAYHLDTMPVGVWDGARTLTDDGLVLSGFVSASEPGIQTKVLDGTIGASSVGVWPREIDLDADDGVPIWTKVGLQEASLVPLGADPGARGHEVIENSAGMAGAGVPAGRIATTATWADSPALDRASDTLGDLRSAVSGLSVAGARQAVAALRINHGR